VDEAGINGGNWKSHLESHLTKLVMDSESKVTLICRERQLAKETDKPDQNGNDYLRLLERHQSIFTLTV
jgi:hypothetical protein